MSSKATPIKVDKLQVHSMEFGGNYRDPGRAAPTPLPIMVELRVRVMDGGSRDPIRKDKPGRKNVCGQTIRTPNFGIAVSALAEWGPH
jgi:hypothetical protein